MITRKMFFSLFVIISSVISGINSLSLVNNVSVSSDVFSQVFVEEIRNNPNKVYTSGPDFGQHNSEKCLSSLRKIVKESSSLQVARLFDAWGSIPAGVLTGNMYDLGNYDQCVKSSISFTASAADVISYQYCFVKLPLEDPTLAINIAICIPNTCSPDLITSIFKESTKATLGPAFSNISIELCSDGKVGPLTATNIAGISVFVVLTVLVLLSSAYDIYVSYNQEKPNPVLIAFSMLTNGKRLFAINTKRSPNNIDCLTGIRVIATLWIIMHHTFIHASTAAVINSFDIRAWTVSLEYMPIYNGSMTVDSFFFMGGLLVAWIGFKELDKTNGKINFIMNIVHRYIRLTPILAAGLILAYSVNSIIYTGPLKETFVEMRKCNSHNWWPILLYVQNYVRDPNLIYDACYAEAWYLAIDFQLYALSPLILLAMWKWGKKFVPVLVALGLASIGWVMGIYISEQYTGLALGANPHEWETIYTQTHTRFAPWLIGFGFGYFMHKNRQSQFNISKIVQIVCWFTSFFTLVAIIMGPYFSIHANGKGTVFEATMYEGLKRVSWALAHAWITFACFYGFGGIVDVFLSHPLWQPLGRLSYAMYMMHMPILRMHYGLARTEIYFSTYTEFLAFWGVLGITILYSIYVTLLFESPILALEKVIFSRDKPVKKDNAVQGQAQPPPVFNIVIDSEENNSKVQNKEI
ncbi:O-acyltransferase like protein-like [Eupeodes corollae]|uniref:O-acyltransferase like protein-like n=1 Tax=Eupeodes corollae TaxID=290404 RepID=UPI002490F5A9|nr:O-acyltransferase like protein-like [Eupeodes corollae]